MSIDTKQIIHIASEVVVIGGITAYFMNKTNKLTEQIYDLEMKLSQQQEIIQSHENLLLKLLNTVNDMQMQQRNQFVKASVPKTHSEQNKEKTISIKNSKNIVKDNVKDDKIKSSPLPQNLMSSRQVVIMVPSSSKNNNDIEISNKVEEIIDEDICEDDTCSYTLDKELEEELKDLDNEIQENVTLKDEEKVDDKVEEIDGDDI